MISLKKNLRKSRVRYFYLLILAVIFCVCTEIPEHCADGRIFDPQTQFCVDNTPYTKCDDMVFEPQTEFCADDNKTYIKCNGREFDPRLQFCIDTSLHVKCNGDRIYDPKIQGCDEDGNLRMKCGDKLYNPATHECDEDEEPNPIVTPDEGQFFVAFDTNGGSPALIAPIIVSSGAAMRMQYPRDPVRADHIFEGWFDMYDIKYEEVTAITNNVILTAKWTKIITDDQEP